MIKIFKRDSVHTINLIYCPKITDTGLEYLKGVHQYNFSLCNNITDAGLKYLE